MKATANKNNAQLLWRMSKQSCPTAFQPLLALSALFSACTFGCATSEHLHTATQLPPVKTINWAVPENSLTALRDAAADGVITDDEVIAYGRTLIFDAPDPRQRPMDASDARLYNVTLGPQYYIIFDSLVHRAQRDKKEYVHLIIEPDGSSKETTELYLPTARLAMLDHYCHATEHSLGLRPKQYLIRNSSQSSLYLQETRTTYFNAREEFRYSADFFFFTVAHEGGHAYQCDYDPWQKDPRRRASRLKKGECNFVYHLEENKADSLAAELSPGHVKGAFECFIGDISQLDEDTTRRQLDKAAKPDLPDTHAPGLERIKRMMRIAGRKLQ